MNQCDGCLARRPLVNGAHMMGSGDGYVDIMACTKDRYVSEVKTCLMDESLDEELGAQ